MPEALATTKRKFHRLLDSRFGSSQAPSPPPPSATTNPSASSNVNESRITVAGAAAEPAAKRIRSGEASLRSTLTDRNTSRTSLSSVRSFSTREQPNKTTTATTAASARTGVRPASVSAYPPSAPPPRPAREPPNFAPWSHDLFLSRLRTFSRVTLWHPKPEAVGEVEWAKRGWSCVDTNTVSCKGGCGQRVLVDVDPEPRRRRRSRVGNGDGLEEEDGSEDEDGIDDDAAENLERALVERYKDLIIDGHAEGCLWRQAGCKPDIYRLPIVKTSVWQPELRERYNVLLKISSSLQIVHIKPEELQPSPEKLLADLPVTLLSPPPTNGPPSTPQQHITQPAASEPARARALVVAMCGWHGVIDCGTELLCCDACFQRVGLWMYQPNYNKTKTASSSPVIGSSSAATTNHEKQNGSDSTAAAAAAADDDEDEEDEKEDRTLDLLDLHREHCPWRNATTQSATGDYAGFPAWKILHTILARYADEHRRRSRNRLFPAIQQHQQPSRASSELVEHNAIAGNNDEVSRERQGGEIATEEDFGTELMPELTREETERLDKERTSKLRRLKSVFGFNRVKNSSASAPASGAGSSGAGRPSSSSSGPAAVRPQSTLL
ncbi:hypothetical protein AAFC00_004181 [Neodothiora populina]|uniref:Zf-C3HC-domain-containing protein n=1 Tax=Neodothiora populina TaxID=2781224 RepID=A0ABR3PJX7_9PEZI